MPKCHGSSHFLSSSRKWDVEMLMLVSLFLFLFSEFPIHVFLGRASSFHQRVVSKMRNHTSFCIGHPDYLCLEIWYTTLDNDLQGVSDNNVVVVTYSASTCTSNL